MEKHIAKRDEINLRYIGVNWLLGQNSKLSIDNELLIYKTILKPIWTYGIHLWDSKNYILKQISNAPWFIKNAEDYRHLNINTVKEEIQTHCTKYKTRLVNYPNQLAVQLTIPKSISRFKKRKFLES